MTIVFTAMTADVPPAVRPQTVDRAPRRGMDTGMDAVVIGAGHNGLVAANLLADAGWSVLVVEAENEPGGATRSGELIEPGFLHDRFSAFYPLAAASPVFPALGLELPFRHGPLVLAHP